MIWDTSGPGAFQLVMGVPPNHGENHRKTLGKPHTWLVGKILLKWMITRGTPMTSEFSISKLPGRGRFAVGSGFPSLATLHIKSFTHLGEVCFLAKSLFQKDCSCWLSPDFRGTRSSWLDTRLSFRCYYLFRQFISSISSHLISF